MLFDAKALHMTDRELLLHLFSKLDKIQVTLDKIVDESDILPFSPFPNHEPIHPLSDEENPEMKELTKKGIG